MTKTIKKSQLKESAIKTIKGFIYAQYDAFENRKENPNVIGRRGHDYYWEAVGIFTFLKYDLGLMSDVEFEQIKAGCKQNCIEYGCKHMYFKNQDLEIPSYCMTWSELEGRASNKK